MNARTKKRLHEKRTVKDQDEIEKEKKFNRIVEEIGDCMSETDFEIAREWAFELDI